MMSENTDITYRVEALREAARIISGERDAQYGGPEENFERIAKIWSVILRTDVSQEDVAMCMVGVKMARYSNNSGFQADTWVDIAGYAGCGYEVGKLAVEKGNISS
jgi:hypothetical protein